ncbi:BTB/POZ domain-containing protein At3g56230-like [Amborella trichopoda]|uniref:BTB/POZ domain-containing protein At3g56230-like n=1 Tax=Amborella trichopoda TaxID=13333 RepID=UPI0009BCD639|nr:BTB/POZ domain-containing protein At3g56230-like [Amborella trichopoda]XP_020521811.1 BTB/POZ domain-containing protein At3g56230-like [Amborella trichopoda]|eukprot:XP_020521810.1 BTB/POZ domain-containing protein At3g56230-like [Amborella trichopoda]
MHVLNDRFVELRQIKDALDERVGFLDELKFALENGTHADIHLERFNGPVTLAHKAILASRSPIFRTMLEVDECKAQPKDALPIPDMNSHELKALLEFLYRGFLPNDEFRKHAHSLLVAADKFDIPFLEKQCEYQIVRTLDSSNVLEVLELSETCSNETLKENALKTIVAHQNEILFSERYVKFARGNAELLCLRFALEVQIFLILGGGENSNETMI